MDQTVYPTKDAVASSKLVVNIFCNDETEHNAKKKYGNEEWCEHNYGQICEEHVANHRAKSGNYFNGSIPNPTTILCMPDGTEITRKKGAASNKELADMIKTAQGKVGAGLERDLYLFHKGKIKAGDDAVAAGKLKDAIEEYSAVTKGLGKNPAGKNVLEQAQAKLNDINAEGLKKIEDAKALAAEGKVEDARKLLKEVYGSYKGLESSKTAEKEMAALPKDK
jgi:hypothetical protein